MDGSAFQRFDLERAFYAGVACMAAAVLFGGVCGGLAGYAVAWVLGIGGEG